MVALLVIVPTLKGRSIYVLPKNATNITLFSNNATNIAYLEMIYIYAQDHRYDGGSNRCKRSKK